MAFGATRPPQRFSQSAKCRVLKRMQQTTDQNPSGDLQDRSPSSIEKAKTKTRNTMPPLWCSHENCSNDDTRTALRYSAKPGLNQKHGLLGYV